jgi:DNA-binding transcriptional LysR family regulator
VTADDLAAGRLVRPVEHARHEEAPEFLVCLPEDANTPRIGLFRDWLFHEIAQTPCGTPSTGDR